MIPALLKTMLIPSLKKIKLLLLIRLQLSYAEIIINAKILLFLPNYWISETSKEKNNTSQFQLTKRLSKKFLTSISLCNSSPEIKVLFISKVKNLISSTHKSHRTFLSWPSMAKPEMSNILFKMTQCTFKIWIKTLSEFILTLTKWRKSKNKVRAIYCSRPQCQVSLPKFIKNQVTSLRKESQFWPWKQWKCS